MSYNIAIVIPPVPLDDARAWAALDELIERQGPRPAVFQELHDRLTARYPCLCALPDDQLDETVWSDGPLINNFGHRAAVLGMSYPRVEEVLPFLIETATALGLVVFDWATQTIYRTSSDVQRSGSTAAEAMDLELASGRVIHGVTEGDILACIEGEEFAILSARPNTYIQCAEKQEPPYAYVLEYQDGSLAEHYRAADEPITLDRVLSAFVKYLRGDASWRTDFRWEKLKL